MTYISDEIWEKIKPALKQALGVALLVVFVKWSKCPLLSSIFMRDDFAQIFLKRFKRRMEYENEIYRKWLSYPCRSYKK